MKKCLLVTLMLSLAVCGWSQLPQVKELSETFVKVAEKMTPAVVTVTSEKVVRQEGMPFSHPFFDDEFFRRFFDFPDQDFRSTVLGSGVIVDAHSGYIITNNHVVEGAEEITVFLIDEREFSAEIVGTDPESDVAVLKIDADDLVAAKLGDSDELDVGEWILAIGSPFSKNLSHTVTAGIVSAKGRSQIINGTSYLDFIQTDAAINPGNSGGAMVNLDGELVGINTAIATGGFSRGNVGIGFAIPINLARKVMEDLITKGKVVRAWLGVYIQDVDDGIAKALGLQDRQGVIVSRVVEGSPADKAGIQIEDVIVEFDGKKVRDAAHLKKLVSTSPPSTRTSVEVIRKKKRKTLRVALAELPSNETVLASSPQASRVLGLAVETVSAELLKRFGLKEDASGVVVVEVSSNSAAARAGIRPGDIIPRVGNREISSREDFYDAVKEYADRQSILFLVKRRGGSLFIPVENK